jgi:glycosyltransferase involved in cell wall biosynthesis
MKILYVITLANFGGAQNIVKDIANHLCADDDIIIATGEEGPMLKAIDDHVKKIVLKHLGRSIHPLKDIRAFFELRKLYRKEKPDLVHLFSSKGLVLGSLVFPSKRIIWSINGFDSLRKKYRKFLFILKLVKNRNRAICVESKYDEQNMIKEGFAKDNMYVIRNGADPCQVVPDVAINGTEKYRKVVMNIARIAPQKRFESFVEIAKMLPQYAFVWIGADKDYNNLPPNLFCLKGESNAKRYLQLADIFVLPTNYEGIPLAIVEALSYSKPVVASDVGGISEIVLNGQNGYVLKNDNQLFVHKIKYILENEATYQQFSKKSLEIFQSKLTKKVALAGYKKVYEIVYHSL